MNDGRWNGLLVRYVTSEFLWVIYLKTTLELQLILSCIHDRVSGQCYNNI
jgi:hypothetical protein